MSEQKNALVLGAGGFIGSHLVTELVRRGYRVSGADKVRPHFSETDAQHFIIADLRDLQAVNDLFFSCSYPPTNKIDEVYQLAADMGGWQHIFSGDHDAEIVTNSALINLNVAQACITHGVKKLFFSSSACVYPEHLQDSQFSESLKEDHAFPAEPDSPYGWEKIFSEILYSCYHRNNGLDIRIARFHNIFGPKGTYMGGRQKAPADICRQVAMAEDGGSITLMGDGQQNRSFLYIDECVEGVCRLMDSQCITPLNIGSTEMISINDLAKMVIRISGKDLKIEYKATNALGVRQRNSNNEKIRKVLGWAPSATLEEGIRITYDWIESRVGNGKA